MSACQNDHYRWARRTRRRAARAAEQGFALYFCDGCETVRVTVSLSFFFFFFPQLRELPVRPGGVHHGTRS